MPLPANLKVASEPDWIVLVYDENGAFIGLLSIRGRNKWKKLTAVSHARYTARLNPSFQYVVEPTS